MKAYFIIMFPKTKFILMFTKPTNTVFIHNKIIKITYQCSSLMQKTLSESTEKESKTDPFGSNLDQSFSYLLKHE